MRALRWGLAGLAGLAALGLLHLLGRPAPQADEPAPAPRAGAAPEAAPSPAWLLTEHPPAAGGGPVARAASLRGSELDGGWSQLDAQGQLVPALALRQRFDHLHTQWGERSLAQIEVQLCALVADAGLSAAHISQVLALHARYLQLLQWPWQVHADRLQPHTWAAAVAERQRVRRQLLGAEWATAFFAAEEAQWRAAMEGTPTPDPAEPPRHPDAEAREAALAAQWRDWEARLAAARHLAQQLARDPSRSDVQRESALQLHLAEHFTADERPRVEALLANPSP